MASHSTAHYFLEGLVEVGIDYVFSNLGTDHVSLIEALAQWDRDGRAHPAMVLCPHENVAVHMAGGYAAMTGKGQAAMVHADAGTANSSMALHNLFRARLPVFLMAGKAPYTLHGELPGSRDNYVHFVQDPYAIGSLVRPYEALRADDILINEGIRNSLAVLNQIERTRPQCYVGLAGGGLGFSGGMALGAKLARPQQRVVQIVGDGGFHFSNPTAVYAVAQQYRLPIFTVVLDNGGWQAVKEAVLRMHPDGAAAASNQFQARLDGEQRGFAQVAAAFGAHAETIDDPDALRGAIGRCFAAVERGQAAVLCARVTPL